MLALGEETAVQAIVGSIVWAFRRLKKPRCRGMSARGYALHSVCPQLSFLFFISTSTRWQKQKIFGQTERLLIKRIGDNKQNESVGILATSVLIFITIDDRTYCVHALSYSWSSSNARYSLLERLFLHIITGFLTLQIYYNSII